ncbi:MAG TPA: hypothetical protein VFW44_08175 [Bryobacteraceae bacterium]|nr:hypothetical protein [Bryobacteraceae bacterium]
MVDRLRALSAQEKVPWAETSDERTFQAALNGYAVSIAEEDAGDNYGEPITRFVIRFYDAAGKLLDTATEIDFGDRQMFDGRKHAREALHDLHDQARRKALRVDQALDDLLKSL